ncbi:uncharacterized protein DEA37_0012170 [Paragonimus westermani]|uniref:Uncharacterized protein n=1 Tax=Paragonimus westermani TaxID=34504 RepID=A0A5J4NL46_9TREM|nr:uncharacterized protein DEA37_0012170 [Paragonimus westermani]
MEPAAYILFDELYDSMDKFRSLLSDRTSIPVRLLGRLSAFEPHCNVVEIISPTKADKCPCILVSVQYLSDELKQNLTGHAAEERLIQFIGDLSLPADRERYHLTAFASSFMDGVDLNVYRSVAKITRSYVKHLPALS